MGRLTNLRMLDLSNNMLTGKIIRLESAISLPLSLSPLLSLRPHHSPSLSLCLFPSSPSLALFHFISITGILSLFYCSGVLPLSVVSLISSMRCSRDCEGVCVEEAGPGFTLPANIGDLDPAITRLDLGHCNLTGAQFSL